MAELRIRTMTKKDLNCIAQMEELCFAAPWSKSALESELNNPSSHYSILEADGTIVGYAGMWVVLDEAYVTNVAVHPDHRRKGYGKVIMIDLMKKAMEKGALAMTLEVRKSNVNAQALYYKLGFVNEGMRKGFYLDNNEDALILWNRNIAKEL